MTDYSLEVLQKHKVGVLKDNEFRVQENNKNLKKVPVSNKDLDHHSCHNYSFTFKSNLHNFSQYNSPTIAKSSKHF